MADSAEDVAEEAVDGAQEARQEVKPWMKPFTRLGYMADGVVYVVIGYLALQAALGPQDPSIQREEALREILIQPLGQFLLIVVAVGLLGYAGGHFLMATRSQAKEDQEGMRSWVNRGAHILNGLFHISLALAAAELVFGFGGGSDRGPDDWTALVMQQPWGRWAVGLVGLGIVGFAIYEAYKAYTANFREVLALSEMSEAEERWITWAGRVGYTVRSIVYGIIAFFLIQAALQYDPDEAGGLGQALAAVASQSYGPWMLGTVAVGLIAFGIYVIFLGRYRKFDM